MSSENHEKTGFDYKIQEKKKQKKTKFKSIGVTERFFYVYKAMCLAKKQRSEPYKINYTAIYKKVSLSN